MHLVSTYLPPTATSHAVKCNLGEDLLVVARINRLDVYKLLPNGLELSSSLELLSRVAALHEVSPDSGPGALLVITDHPDCTALIVEFSVKEQKLVVQSSHKLTSSIKRPLAGCTVCAVSADRRYAAVALYLGSMNIFSFGRKNGGIILEMKSESPISELLLSSFAFVPNPTNGEVTIALLYRTHSDEMKLSFKTIDEDTLDVSRDGHIVDMMKHAFQRLIPISSRGEGLLVIGDERIVYHGTQKKDRKQKSPIEGRRKSDLKQREAHILTEWQYSDITGYGVIDGERILISDKYGKLVMIVIDKEKEGMQAHLLGEASSASCIAYINAGVIFLGSETGDSQLVQITSSGSLEVVDTYPNTAPIIDATLADIDNSGDPIVVTCSGEGKTGSLRIIRTGANIEEVASIGDTKGVTRVFLLKDGTESDSYLLLSYPQETKIVNIKDSHTYSEVPENDFAGLVRDSTTLVAANLEVEYSHLAIQVTRTAVNLINMQTGEQCNRWPGDIVSACIHGDMICVGLHDNSLLLLHVDQDRKLLKDGKQAQFGSQISAVSMRSDSTGKSNIFLGFWQKHVIQILNTDTLERMAEIEVPHVPLSIVPWEHDFPVVHRFHLLIGTGNGHIVTMRLRSKGASFDIGERRLIYLGERPVHLQKYVDQGKENVIATGKRAVILSRSNRSVVQHHINIKDIEAVLPFNTPRFSNTLMFKLPSSLLLARIGKLEKIKIDSVSLGYDVPVSIAYHSETHAFALGCVRREPSRDEAYDATTSSFKLLDATTFEHLNSYSVPSTEEITKVCVTSLGVNDGDISSKYIAVGTAVWGEDESEPTKGRILLFTAVNTQSTFIATRNASAPILNLMLEQEITGAVVSMCGLGDAYLAVIVNTILVVYQLTRKAATNELQLKPVDQWIHNYMLSSLVVNGSDIVIGDTFQSVTLLRWTGSEIKLVSKDYETVNSLNATLDDTHIIQSNVDNNLFSYKNEEDGIQPSGRYHFGEVISSLVPGSVSTNAARGGDKALAVPKHLLFTSGGRISVISKCDDERAMKLHNIQRNIGAAFKSDHYDVLSWRAPHTSIKTFSDDIPQASGFIDGDLLLRFLELESDSPLVKKILNGTKRAERLDMEYGELREFIEELQTTQY
ncbi:hypothetical protein FRC16_010750 [Serendipita sp. 398]|nr:hypothetical protein FRC16_010750 [Serendipita sp. 398]